MNRIASVKPLPGFRLHLKFEDGVSGEVVIADRLFGPVFEPLRDPSLFARVSIDEFGVVCWPNGADLAPDTLHAALLKEPARIS